MPPRFYADPFRKDSEVATLVAVEPLTHDIHRSVDVMRDGVYIVKHARATYSDGSARIVETARESMDRMIWDAVSRPRRKP